jgi:hypothetical protein
MVATIAGYNDMDGAFIDYLASGMKFHDTYRSNENQVLQHANQQPFQLKSGGVVLPLDIIHYAVYCFYLQH